MDEQEKNEDENEKRNCDLANEEEKRQVEGLDEQEKNEEEKSQVEGLDEQEKNEASRPSTCLSSSSFTKSRSFTSSSL